MMTRATPLSRFHPGQHDHDSCVTQAMDMAEALCRDRGLRFTRLRRQVLELVWTSHRPIGAYELLDRLNGIRHKVAPPTVYRALDFLIEADLVHRLDSINAYIGCPDPGRSHTGQFLICRECRTVAELDDADIHRLVERKASDLGFRAVHQMLEIEGLCPNCRQKGPIGDRIKQ